MRTSTHAHSLWLALLLLALLAPVIVHADGFFIAGRHESLSVVPAPGPVTIDGKLDDWDLSGEILTYEFPETAEKRHARTALMYDKDNLYVYAYFKDTTPMHSFIDGKVDNWRGWDGDCLQLKLANDPAVGYPIKLAQAKPVGRDVQIWYFEGRHEPQICYATIVINENNTLKYQKDMRNYFGADSGVAFQQLDGAYVLEARIPWQRLDMPGPPAPGTKLAFTTQHLWGNSEGTKCATSINDVTAPGGGFTYQSAGGWGYLLFEPKGHLPRQREEIPKPLEVAKKLVFTYTLPQACKVSLGIFNAQGELVRTLLTAEGRPAGKNSEQWDGLNDFGDVLPAGTYTFKALTHQGFTQEWVVSLLNSGTPPWHTADGAGSWGGEYGTPTDVVCAGDRAYLLWQGCEGGRNLQACTLDGKKLWGNVLYLTYNNGFGDALATDGTYLYISQKVAITRHEAASGRPVNFPGDKRGIEIPGGEITDLALRAGHLYALAKGVVHDIAIEEGRIVRALPVGDGAVGLAVAPGANALLFVRDSHLCRLNPETGAIESLFRMAVEKPAALTVSPDGARVYISDQGRAHNEVQVFSYPDGKVLGTVGKPGGRPALGKFDRNGLFQPGGLAFDSRGRLWVAEMDSTPNRFSVWQPTGKQGKYITDYFGPAMICVGATADPAQPEYVYLQNTRWIVDYDKHTAKLDCTFARPGYDGPQPVLGQWAGQTIRVQHVNGHTLLYSHTSVWEMQRDHAVPVWAFGQGWVWSDKNHDGFMQEDEKEQDTGPSLAHYWGQNMRSDLTMEHSNQFSKEIYLRHVAGWQNGLPVWQKASEMKPFLTTLEKSMDSAWNPSMTRCYALESNDAYYKNDMRRNGIACYTPDGKRLWRFMAGVGMDCSAPLTKFGEIRGAQKFIGFLDTGAERAGEVFGVNGYFGDYNLLNEDGLFVTEIGQDGRRGAQAGPNTAFCENFNGYLFRHPKTKKVYLIGGDLDGRIWEIKGFENLKRFSGALAITAQDVQAATQALAEYQQAAGTRSTRTTLRRMAAPPALDGGLAGWDFTQAVKIDAGAGRNAKAMAAYDDKYLYVAYRVVDDTPFLNTGNDATLLFKTGDLADVILCTQAGADPNRNMGKGDTRILFAPFQGKSIAVVMQKVADGGVPAPTKYTSSQQPEEFERVAVLAEARVAVQRNPDGYTLEAAVPLAAIGFHPEQGKAYPFDLGVLFGNPAGTTTIMRAYWANQDTQIVNDTPTETRIVPANLGTAVVE